MSRANCIKRLQRRSNIALSISFILIFISLYLFFSTYNSTSTWLLVLSSQWCVAFSYLGFCWYILALNPPPSLPRKEELKNRLLRFIILIPINIILFGSVQSKVDFIVAMSSTIVLCIFFLSLDKSEINCMIVDLSRKK